MCIACVVYIYLLPGRYSRPIQVRNCQSYYCMKSAQRSRGNNEMNEINKSPTHLFKAIFFSGYLIDKLNLRRIHKESVHKETYVTHIQ